MVVVVHVVALEAAAAHVADLEEVSVAAVAHVVASVVLAVVVSVVVVVDHVEDSVDAAKGK